MSANSGSPRPAEVATSINAWTAIGWTSAALVLGGYYGLILFFAFGKTRGAPFVTGSLTFQGLFAGLIAVVFVAGFVATIVRSFMRHSVR